MPACDRSKLVVSCRWGDERRNTRVNTPVTPRRLIAGLSLSLVALHTAPLRAADAPAATVSTPAAATPAPFLPPLPDSALAPAAVPRAVAIGRPSPTEVSQLNEAYQKFISGAGADAATKNLLTKYSSVFAMHVLRAKNPALIPGLSPEAREQRRADQGRTDRPRVHG
jgi:hypothetical protein